mmetsp:Transcript_73436/g.203958  ORF Transcript_73436/g.203958 Transcript_73436/m.203958 type:complete len:211 (+) Transcript_73436:1769-2401(+)
MRGLAPKRPLPTSCACTSCLVCWHARSSSRRRVTSTLFGQWSSPLSKIAPTLSWHYAPKVWASSASPQRAQRKTTALEQRRRGGSSQRPSDLFALGQKHHRKRLPKCLHGVSTLLAKTWRRVWSVAGATGSPGWTPGTSRGSCRSGFWRRSVPPCWSSCGSGAWTLRKASSRRCAWWLLTWTRRSFPSHSTWKASSCPSSPSALRCGTFG